MLGGKGIISEKVAVDIMNKGVSFKRNCGAASVGEYSRQSITLTKG